MSENPFKVTSPLLPIRSLPNSKKHIPDHKVFCKDRTVLFLKFFIDLDKLEHDIICI